MDTLSIVNKYRYHIMWDDNEQEYVVHCFEFPSLSFFAEDFVEAVSGMKYIILSVIKDMLMNNEEIPKPLFK